MDYLHRQDCCDQLCEDCTRRMETNPLRVLDCKQEKCRCVTDEAPRLLDYNCPECKEHFDTVLRLLDAAGERLMKGAFDRLGLTGRSHDRILRMARTIADLDASPDIQAAHLAEAIQYRSSTLLK